jgi:hypothetical protein
MVRGVWPVAVIVLAVGLGGCGGTAQTGAEPTQSPLATAPATPSSDGTTSSDAVAWAGGVCSAADGLEQSLDALGASLEVDLGSDQQLVDQLGPQVEAQAEDVRAAVETLTSALTAVPEPADPDVVAAAEELQAERQSLQDSVAALQEAAATLGAASDTASLVQGVAAAVAQLAVVRLDAATFADGLQSAAEQGATAVRAAFVDAPECDSRV